MIDHDSIIRNQYMDQVMIEELEEALYIESEESNGFYREDYEETFLIDGEAYSFTDYESIGFDRAEYLYD